MDSVKLAPVLLIAGRRSSSAHRMIGTGSRCSGDHASILLAIAAIGREIEMMARRRRIRSSTACRPQPWQFGIRGILQLTLVCAVVLAAVHWLGGKAVVTAVLVSLVAAAPIVLMATLFCAIGGAIRGSIYWQRERPLRQRRLARAGDQPPQ